MFLDQESSPYGITGDYIETVVPMLDYPPADGGVTHVDAVDDTYNVLYYHRKKQVTLSQPLPQSDSELDLTDMYNKVKRTRHNRTIIADVANGLAETTSFDNAIAIDDVDIEDFNNLIGSRSAYLAEKFRSTYLPMSLSYDHASAYVEAFMRDGLDIDGFQIDHDLSHHINAMIKLDALHTIVKDLSLPEALKTEYYLKVIDSLISEVNTSIKSDKLKTIADRYRMELDNPVGVRTSSMGSVALRSHRNGKYDHEEKAK